MIEADYTIIIPVHTNGSYDHDESTKIQIITQYDVRKPNNNLNLISIVTDIIDNLNVHQHVIDNFVNCLKDKPSFIKVLSNAGFETTQKQAEELEKARNLLREHGELR